MYILTPKVFFIPFLVFALLGSSLGLQLFLEILENFYECVISLELCGKLIFTKRGLMI